MWIKRLLRNTWVFAVIMLAVVALFSWILASSAFGYEFLTGATAHEKMIYPIVRVTTGQAGGSGTLVYSKPVNDPATQDKYSTYVLTNFHVIAGAISRTSEWDSDLKKNVQVEHRGTVYVEIFQYRGVSTTIGVLKVESDIAVYNENEDMALLHLRTEKQIKNIADIAIPGSVPELVVMSPTVAVGCSLLFPPLPTTGILTRLNLLVYSLPYHMSSSQIIYGNSGGAMFVGDTGRFIGIPSLVAVAGWSTPITHMGLFIPIERICTWLKKQHYQFIYDGKYTEKVCLEDREKDIAAKVKKDK
uniref:Putative trypsin-like peptidase domain containing protein n=1 Tax=viral metagenome TaxID=1070528 RepID=A0A6M3LSF4_9ZZZZ